MMGREEYKAWLSTIKVGDKFAFQRDTFRGAYFETMTVVRLTSTQFVCTDENGLEIRFRRDRGSAVGGNHYKCIEPITDRLKAKQEEFKLRQWFERIHYCNSQQKKLTVDQLRAMKEAHDLHEPQPNKEGGAA